MASSSLDAAVAWYSDNLSIINRAGNRQRLALNQPQMLVHNAFERQRERTGRVKALILKARREGVSTYIAARFYHRGVIRPHTKTFVMAHKEDSARELAQIYECYWDNQPSKTRPPRSGYQRLQELVLDDPRNPGTLNSRFTINTAGQTLVSASGVGRGGTNQQVHMSEAAYYAQGKATAVGLLQSAEGPGTEVIVESTGNGMSGWFYDTWHNADNNPESEWLCIFLPWWIDAYNSSALLPERHDHIMATLDAYESKCMTTGLPFKNRRFKLTPEQIAWRRTKLHTDFSGDVLAFQQEYPATPEEAFIASGDCYFDLESLAELVEEIPVELKPERVTLHMQGNDRGPASASPDKQGALLIWRQPDPARSYVIGADAASGMGRRASFISSREGATPHDASAAYVIDVRTMEAVAAYHSYADTDMYADDLWCLGWLYNHALIGLETNGPGLAVLDSLRGRTAVRPGYTRLMPTVQIKDRSVKVTSNIGWNTSESNRYFILATLKSELRAKKVKVYDTRFYDECRSFLNVQLPTGKIKPQAGSGAHDDRVMSMAIGVWVANFGRSAEMIDEAFADSGGLDPFVADSSI